MRLGLIALALVVAAAAAAEGDKWWMPSASKGPTDGPYLAAVREVGHELGANAPPDNAVWERWQSRLQHFGEATGLDAQRRRLRATAAPANIVTDHLESAAEKGWQLLLGTFDALDAAKLKVTDFLSDILGRDWSQHLPPSWHDGTLTFDKLGMFDFSSNLQDFISSQLDNIRALDVIPDNLGELKERLDTAVDHFCRPEELEHPEKVPTTCEGPTVTIAYVPKTCTIHYKEKEILCDPAKLVLTKTPGQCTPKRISAFRWKPKECALTAEIGVEKTKVIGGRESSVDFTDVLHEKTQDVLEVVRPGAPAAVTTEAVPTFLAQRMAQWLPPENHALYGILKYHVACESVPANDANMRFIKVGSHERSAIIGAATTGDNRGLAPNTQYVCSVAGINAAGVGTATFSAEFTTLTW